MTATVLHLPRGKKHLIPAKKRETIATGEPADGKTPLTELTLPEMLAVQKWVRSAVADIVIQAQRSAKEPNMTAKRLAPILENAELITLYLGATDTQIEQMLAAIHIQPPADTEMDNA